MKSPLRFTGVLGVLLLGLLFIPVSALAFPYEPLAPFGSPGTGDGQLELGTHSGVAANFTTDDIYVADSENHRVDQGASLGVFA